MSRLLKGKDVTKALNEKNTVVVQQLKEKGITPTLAIFRVGEKDADLSYEKGAYKRCEEVGVIIKQYLFSEDVTVDEFYEKLDEANNDPDIHGILVFRPLPKDRFDDEVLRNRIAPEKDVDGCSNLSLAGIFTNKNLGFAPCTAEAAMAILEHYDIDVEGKNVVVIGRSLVIGKPVSMLLLNKNATVTICHTKTKQLSDVCAKADILICCAGRPGMITREFTNPKQIVIDVGIDWDHKRNKLSGDVLFEEVEEYVDSITPVPGGVGSVTTAILVDHVIKASKRLNKIQD